MSPDYDALWAESYQNQREIQTWVEAGERIRAAHPLAGQYATEADAVARKQAEVATLKELGIDPGERHWFTAIMPDDSAIGMWAHSRAEATIGLVIWHGDQAQILDIFEDDEALIYKRHRSRDRSIELARARGAEVTQLSLFDELFT